MSSITAASVGGAGQSAAQVAPQPRLVRAAHEFEAQMMKELLKPMTSGNGLDGEDGAASGSGSALGRVCLRGAGSGAERAGRIWDCQSASCASFPIPVTGTGTAQVTKNLHSKYRHEL